MGDEVQGFGVLLRRFRRQVRLTQDELAARAAIGVRTVRDLERGRASRPQRSTVELLATALDLAGPDRELFLAVARGQSPEPEPPPRRASMLPAPEALIGRDGDVTDLAALLTAPPPDGTVLAATPPAGVRMVTLVGLAGVGKTALALVVCHALAAAHPAGVGGIVVTEGFTAGEILGSAAAAFGVGPLEDLAARLSTSSAVLLVDAVERSPDAVAEAASQLLDRFPTLRIVATGRHPVGLAAERVWPLAPLAVPPSEVPSAGDEAYPAVALFLDRLARVRREPVRPDELPALPALVRRLGGLPLAIELAAARGRVLTLTEILDRYGDRVLDLGGRPGDAIVSLREAVAASYRLLTPAEQFGLRRLAMLRHRWSLAVAEQMIQEHGSDVVHLLDRLLELGLLSVRGTGTFRFRLVDVVRDFAAERAAAEGELTAGRRRHAEVLADLAEHTAPGLAGARLTEAASRFDDVAGDLGTALSFAAGDDPHTALRLATALPRWWRFRGRDVSGRQWLRRLLDDPRTADADPSIRAWAKVGLVQLALEHGAAAEEIGAAEAALAVFERLGDLPGRLTAHTQLAAAWTSTGGYDEARRHGEEALRLARRSGRIRDMAVAENNLVWHEVREGDLPAARRRLAAVDRLAAGTGETRLRAVAVANLAEVARLDGRSDEAVRLARNALDQLEGVGDPNHRRRVLATLGLALAAAGRLDEADSVLAELWPPGAPGDDRGRGDQPPDGPAAVVEGAIALGRGDHERAAESYARAAQAYRGGHDPRDVLGALVGLVAAAPDETRRRAARARVDEFRAARGITLLPQELALLDE